MRVNRLCARFLTPALLALILAPAVPAGAQVAPIHVGTLSRKAHGTAGTFDLTLAPTPATPTTEPRQGPAQTIVFAFDKPVTGGTAVVTEGAATVGATVFSGDEMIVPLIGVTNQQYVTVAVSNVVAADGGSGGGGTVRVGYLAGDVSQNRVVTLSDLGQVNAQVAQFVTSANFLKDVNASGTLSLADNGITNAEVTRALPPPVGSTPLPGLFAKPHAWNRNVSALAPAARSAAIIATLQGFGGWGNGNKLQTDFSLAVLNADAQTPRRTITAAPGGYCYGGPDCDPVPLQMPLPANGNAEGSTNYVCDTANEDCHVLVVEHDEKKLYELYNATQAGANFTALGAFVWDLTKQYPDVLRGDQCTSADAAGLPMAALLPTADEVAAGEVPHALALHPPELAHEGRRLRAAGDPRRSAVEQ